MAEFEFHPTERFVNHECPLMKGSTNGDAELVHTGKCPINPKFQFEVQQGKQ